MTTSVVKETLKIESAKDLHTAIQYFDKMFSLEQTTIVFPDGLPLARIALLEWTSENGTKTKELVLSDAIAEEEYPWP